MSAAENKAVFLSYASQDAAAVSRIAEALRAAGVEVWFDQNELVGGDAWDAKIRKQIKECALFVPVISAGTQARREGYFRLEWRIAAQRTHMMSESVAFLLPIVIDVTRDTEADVPTEFKAVQWTRLPPGEAPEKFCTRVKTLLGGNVVAGVVDPGPVSARPATKRRASHPWLAPAVLVLAAVVVLAVWRPRQTHETTTAQPSGAAAEIAQLRTKLRPDEWTRADFSTFTPVVNRLIQANSENGEAWALRSIANSLMVIRNFETGTKPLETGKEAVDRALSLAPNSPLAELALGLHLVAMISRGGEARASRVHIERALAGLPAESLTRFAELTSFWLGYQFEGTEKSAQAWLTAEPKASFPAWILAQYYVASRHPGQAAKWAERASADPDITGVRSLVTLFEARYYLQADLVAARTAIDRVPAGQRSEHRVVVSRFLLAMAEQHYDQALQELARLPESMLLDRVFHGPKALLVGMAHLAAGRVDVAQAQLRESERMLREELAHDSENQELRAVLALNLAYLGRADDARRELAAIEPLLRGQEASVYSGQLFALLAQTHGVLGEPGPMALWLRRLFAEPSPLPFTPASLRLDARFAGKLDAPEIQALLKEFASLDQPAGSAVAADKSAPADKSVAVLAFADQSPARDSEYFSDGISDELINALGKVPGLKVPARTSSFYFKGRNVPVPEIAQQLGVAYVIEGSVQRAGDKVKIGARLTKAADGFQVWGESFTRDAKDVFAVEEEIAGLIAKNLSLKLGAGSPVVAAAVKPEALEYYLRARQAWSLRDKVFDGGEGVEELLNRALAIEPNFARAHAMLAEVWVARASIVTNTLSRFDQRNSPEQARVEAKARQAIALDPASPEAHTALALVRWVTWDIAGETRESETALALNPSYAIGHWRHGFALMDDGRMDEALTELKLATQLDPFSQELLEAYGRMLHVAGRYTEAIVLYDRALALADSAVVREHKAYALAQLGRTEDAVAVARGLPKDSWRARTFAVAGLRAEAQAIWGQSPDRPTYDLLLLGQTAKALTTLDAPAMRSPDLHDWLFEPWFDPIRSDLRFKKFLETLGATEAHARAQVWRAAHPPEKVAVKK